MKVAVVRWYTDTAGMTIEVFTDWDKAVRFVECETKEFNEHYGCNYQRKAASLFENGPTDYVKIEMKEVR